MKYASYTSLANALAGVGLIGQQLRPNQLVVSTQKGPVWPNQGNSFWLSYRNDAWYLGTWSPTYYRIPVSQDVAELCLMCMKTGTKAMYRVPDEIVAQCGLQEIDDEEFNRLFPPNPEDE